MMSPEQVLWVTVLNLRVSDAIYPFSIPDSRRPETSIDRQWKALQKRKKLPVIGNERDFNRRRALVFLESAQLDWIAGECGYGDEYVKRVAALVQHCLKLVNRLYG